MVDGCADAMERVLMSEIRERWERKIPCITTDLVDWVIDHVRGRAWFAQLERPEVLAIVRERMLAFLKAMESERKPLLLTDGGARADITPRRRLAPGGHRKALTEGTRP